MAKGMGKDTLWEIECTIHENRFVFSGGLFTSKKKCFESLELWTCAVGKRKHRTYSIPEEELKRLREWLRVPTTSEDYFVPTSILVDVETEVGGKMTVWIRCRNINNGAALAYMMHTRQGSKMALETPEEN